MKNPSIFIVLALAGFLFLPNDTAAYVPITIENGGYAEPEVSYYSPPDEPPETKPQIGPNEGLCKPYVSISGGIPTLTLGRDGNYHITGITPLTIKGGSHILEPYDPSDPNYPDPDLHAHEMGHAELDRWEFMRKAEGKLRKAMETYCRKTYDPYPNRNWAIAAAMQDLRRAKQAAGMAIYKQMQVLGDIYDSNSVTDHGESLLPPSVGVSMTKRRIEEAAKMHPDKDGDGIPDSLDINKYPKPFISGIGAYKRDPNDIVCFYPPAPAICNLSDALNGQAVMEIDGFVPIGFDNSDILWLSDTTLKIVNNINPDIIYLQTAVLDVTRRASNYAGYDWVIEGSVSMEISEINNAINSQFLADFAQSCQNKQTMGFWLYTNDPVMDLQTGSYLTPDTPVPCEIFIGHAENPASVTKQDFEGYAALPDMLADGWQITGANVDLIMDHNISDSGIKAMMFMYDTGIEPLSQAKQMYPVPQNWLISDKETLMISVHFTNPDASDYFYMGIESDGTIMATVMPFDPGASGVHIAMTENDYWKIGIELDSFSAIPGFNMAEITAVAFGLNGNMEPPVQGVFFVDDIRLIDTPASQWPRYDINHDFKVDLMDLALLAEEWLIGTQMQQE